MPLAMSLYCMNDEHLDCPNNNAECNCSCHEVCYTCNHEKRNHETDGECLIVEPNSEPCGCQHFEEEPDEILPEDEYPNIKDQIGEEVQ